MKAILLFIGASFLLVTTQGQSLDVVEKPSISLETCQWLVGYWVGDGFGGTSEEIWSPVSEDGSMMCMYRHTKDGVVSFYEFVSLTPDGMKIKHFAPDMKGWEEKEQYITFPLLSVTPDRLTFEGMEMVRKSDNEMEVTLQLKRQDHEEKEVFHYTRRALEQGTDGN